MKTIRSHILFAILMSSTVLLSGQTTVLSGPVSGTWDLAGSPYMINGEIYIPNQETLSIEPGVEVRFTGWYKFIVNGSLLAEGTEEDQILFTADDTNNRWHGIRFMYATGTSVLDHCIVEYAQSKIGIVYPPDPDYLGGGILCYKSAASSINILNSIIRKNYADWGGGIEIVETCPLIDNCEIINNTAVEGAGIDAWSVFPSSTGIIKNSTIAFNLAETSGGGIFAALNSNLEIKNNVIKHNVASSGAGIKVTSPYELIVEANVIAHNFSWNTGGAVLFCPYDSYATFKNNTIAYNHAMGDGGGMYVTNNCSPSFESDILYFNTTATGGFNQVHLAGTGGAPFLNYCDVQGGYEDFSGPGAPSFPWWTNYLDCIEANPLFADPENDDFSLTWENYPVFDNTRSPCIDSGKPGVFLEPDGTYNDIGYYSFYQELEIPTVLDADSISSSGFLANWTYANPASGYFLDVAEDEAFTLWVLENHVVDSATTFFADDLDPATTYYYRVRAFNPNQQSTYSNTEDVTTLATGIDVHEITELNLYPNPSSGALHLRFSNTEHRTLNIELYSIQGIKVRTLIDQVQQPGEYEMTFDISDLPDGMYFVRIQMGRQVETVKIIKLGDRR